MDNAGLISSYSCTTTLDTTKPVANAGQNKNVNSGATVTFDAGISSDEVGIVSYLWDFGDGSTGTGKTATHTYSSAGTYAAKLTVQDAAGNTETSNVSVTVQENVIPEYSTFTVLFFMITMLTITLLIKKRNLTLK
jgi:PKD repeat protein